MLSPEPGAQPGKERGFCRACALPREPRFFLLLAADCHEEQKCKKQNFQETPKIQILFMPGWGGGGECRANLLILPCFPPNPDLKTISWKSKQNISSGQKTAEESFSDFSNLHDFSLFELLIHNPTAC